MQSTDTTTISCKSQAQKARIRLYKIQVNSVPQKIGVTCAEIEKNSIVTRPAPLEPFQGRGSRLNCDRSYLPHNTPDGSGPKRSPGLRCGESDRPLNQDIHDPRANPNIK